jgi:hypothetical protein
VPILGRSSAPIHSSAHTNVIDRTSRLQHRNCFNYRSYFFFFLYMWVNIPTPHGPCSFCYDPYLNVRNYPSLRQISNVIFGSKNTSFSRSRNDPHSESSSPTWSQSQISHGKLNFFEILLHNFMIIHIPIHINNIKKNYPLQKGLT